MPDVDPIADLVIRRQQLEMHLLQSHEYHEKCMQQMRIWAALKVLALVLIISEAFVYLRDPKLISPLVLGAIGITLAVLIISTALIWRTWVSLNRLNEKWLTPEARKALDGLRLEYERLQGDAT